MSPRKRPDGPRTAQNTTAPESATSRSATGQQHTPTSPDGSDDRLEMRELGTWVTFKFHI